MAKKVTKKATKKVSKKISRQGPPAPGEDYGMQVELYMRRLISEGDENKVYGHASAFEHALGKAACKKLAELLKDSLK